MFAAMQAAAYPAFTNAEVYLRAGPDIDFPIVQVLYPRTLLEVIGCEQDYQWCDVRADAERGWVSADNLVVTFDNREVNVAQNGAAIGLPVLEFLVGAYWANHYVDRPWYNRHPHWSRCWATTAWRESATGHRPRRASTVRRHRASTTPGRTTITGRKSPGSPISALA